VHRIGRTARAGAKGNAISFVCSDGEEAVLAEAAALQNEEVRPFSFKLSAVEGEQINKSFATFYSIFLLKEQTNQGFDIELRTCCSKSRATKSKRLAQTSSRLRFCAARPSRSILRNILVIWRFEGIRF